MSKHTPGPLSVSFGTKWPFEILIINKSGSVVYRDPLLCHSRKDKTFEEALNCRNFKASEQEEYAAINHRAVADAYLRAAAPDLLEACETFAEWLGREESGFARAGNKRDSPEGERAWRDWYEENLRLCALAQDQARAAIAKATGEQP